MTDEKKIYDGGPVFPQYEKPIAPNVVEIGPQGGLTQRDWLAGLAMQGILSNGETTRGIGNPYIVRKLSYEMADAMIVEGQKGGTR